MAEPMTEEESPLLAVNALLWRDIFDPLASLDRKLDALEDLCGVNDPELPRFLADQLHGARQNLRWRASLVQAAEHVEEHDPEIRASLEAGLLRSAMILRDHSQSWADPPMWAAVRTLGGLIAADHAGILLEFLGTDARLRTRQVALQALQSILARGDNAAQSLPGNVRERLAQLASTYVNPDFLVSSETISLGANACCAAFLAKVPNSEELRARVVAANRPALERQIALATARARIALEVAVEHGVAES